MFFFTPPEGSTCRTNQALSDSFLTLCRFSFSFPNRHASTFPWPRCRATVETGQLFVNVVSSQKLAKPYSKPSPSRSGGEMWSLPVAVGQMRLEKDKCTSSRRISGKEYLMTRKGEVVAS